MSLRVNFAWAVLALGLLPFASACSPDDVVRPPEGAASQISADVMGAGIDKGPEFYASPEGSPAGDGSFSNPWDLATALHGSAAVIPGSVIWLRGGTYVNPTDPRGFISTLMGTADAPIVVRQYPGERATVTSTLVAQGAYTWFWGFEITNPARQQEQPLHGVDVRGPRTKLIDLVVHDATDDGIYIAPEAAGAEVTGSIIYNNGRTNNFTHGIYCKSATDTLRLIDNVVFDNWASGFHCYANDGPYIQNIDLEGNAAFNNYVWGVPWDADILVGGVYPAAGITVRDNYTYRTTFANTTTADIGSNVVANQDVVVTNNYFTGGWSRVGNWSTATVTNNTLYDFTTGYLLATLGAHAGQQWSGNSFFGDPTALAWQQDSSLATTFDGWRAETGLVDPGTYAGSVPTGLWIFVRPNRYEPGRANIIFYNWGELPTVSVDVSNILHMGDRYVVRNAEDFYGPPVASGTYTGGPLDLPMVSVTPPSPVGVTTAQPAPVTGPTFNVYVLMRVKPGVCTPDEDGSVRYCVEWRDGDNRPGLSGPERPRQPAGRMHARRSHAR